MAVLSCNTLSVLGVEEWKSGTMEDWAMPDELRQGRISEPAATKLSTDKRRAKRMRLCLNEKIVEGAAGL